MTATLLSPPAAPPVPRRRLPVHDLAVHAVVGEGLHGPDLLVRDLPVDRRVMGPPPPVDLPLPSGRPVIVSAALVAQDPPVAWVPHPVPTPRHVERQWTWEGRLIQGVMIAGFAALWTGATFASQPVCPAP